MGCLVRAFVYNPEVLILHRPLDGAENVLREQILGLLKEFKEQRGCYSTAPWETRRPRTVFFTGGTNVAIPIADFVWKVGDEFDGIREEKGPYTPDQKRTM